MTEICATDAFNKDQDPNKVSLGVGAYRGNDGKPMVLNTVRKAEKIVLEKALNHEYAGITGVYHTPVCACMVIFPPTIDHSSTFRYAADAAARA